MKKILLAFLLVFMFNRIYAQIKQEHPKRERGGSVQTQDSPSKSSTKSTGIENLKNPKAKITDYLIISHKNDTTFVDTTLTIQKEYKFNYLRKDNFGLVPFSNLGQTYNRLTYNFENTKLMPSFGARARHFNYMEIEDINYFHVPTPLTELLFKSAFEQGQLADSFFTINISPQVNVSIAYKGLRSLGKYQHLLTSTGNFRFTTNYSTKNKRYSARAHIVTQDLLNQENGGIQDSIVKFFETGDPDFLDRSILEVNFENAENILKGKRFHLDHAYYIINKKDSTATNKLSIGHTMSFSDKSYQFDQTSEDVSFFGPAIKSSNLRDRVTLEDFRNQLQLNFSNHIIGDLQFNISNNNYNYGYNKVVVLSGNTITNRLKGNVFSTGAMYHKQYKKFKLYGELGINISGEFEGNFIKGRALFNLNKDNSVTASINHSTKAPNYNVLLDRKQLYKL